MMKFPLIKPFMNQEIKDKVCEVLDSGYLTEGPVTHEFESAFRNYIGCRHAIAVTSCTTGLEMALRCLGIGPGDEVIVPDYTYPATAMVVFIVGAKAVIVDVCRDTMLVDCRALEAAITSNTKAIIPVSIFGNPLDYDELNMLKTKYGFYIIEDAACSIGAEFKRRKVGALADISVFSLHPRKFITTGEGGMITTENSAWAEWMESYKHFGMDRTAGREDTVFVRMGTNYKLSNILAAVGLIQMKHVNELLDRRQVLSENYIRLLSDRTSIEIPSTTPSGTHSRQSFCIYVPGRDEVMKEMRKRGIEVQIGTYSLHMHPAFRDGSTVGIRGEMTGSKYVFDHCLTLPLYQELSFTQQEEIAGTIIRLLELGEG
jgi:dTDP-4-amino-4,6-dideoxygalactose transaminase